VFLNIITEMIAGYAWPGKPIANLMVKCYGYNAVKHGMDFAQDLKLGQYMVGYLALFPEVYFLTDLMFPRKFPRASSSLVRSMLVF
jgi:hypothetical protein